MSVIQLFCAFVYAGIGAYIGLKSIELWSKENNHGFWALALFPKATLWFGSWNKIKGKMDPSPARFEGQNRPALFDLFVSENYDQAEVVYVIMNIIFWPLRLVFNLIVWFILITTKNSTSPELYRD